MEELLQFHTKEYIKALFECERDDKFDLEDASAFEDMQQYVAYVAGGTISATEYLKVSTGSFPIVVHLGGGRHHAKPDSASGFCYVNDCVLGIFKLLDRPDVERVLYVDIDAHHGDGVSQAFIYSNEVFCLSFHHFAAGFFPNSGSIREIGKGKGKYHNLNIPMAEGTSDKTFLRLFGPVFSETLAVFRPNVIMLQFGVDACSRDPLGKLNLSSTSFETAMRTIVGTRVPLVVLGGGGYDPAVTASLWTMAMAVIADRELEKAIPDHEFSPGYAPHFEFRIESKEFVKDCNTEDDIREIESQCKEFFIQLRGSPSL